MPQVSLYVDNALMQGLRADAEREGVSLSKYVAQRLRESRAVNRERCNTPSGMPKGYFDRLYGCVDDPTFAVPEELDFSLDAPRIAFD